MMTPHIRTKLATLLYCKTVEFSENGGLLATECRGSRAHRSRRRHGVENLQIVPVEQVPPEKGVCFLTIQYSNFAEVAIEAGC